MFWRQQRRRFEMFAWHRVRESAVNYPSYGCILGLALMLALATLAQAGKATGRSQIDGPVEPCDLQRAVLLAQQQVAEARTIDKSIARLPILIRAADLLWPHMQKKARFLFEEAYDVADQQFEEKIDESRKEGKKTGADVLDQRFVVILAIARRDPEWARVLTKRAVEEARQKAEEAGDAVSDPNAGEALISVAITLLPVDVQAAISFARSSFRYRASEGLARFLSDWLNPTKEHPIYSIRTHSRHTAMQA